MAVDVELMSERKIRAKKGRRDNLFAWTIFLLLLIGVVFVCWIGSFYVFQHPESPRSYSILRKLKKIDPPKRFEPTLAPNGKFYHAKDFLKLITEKTESDLTRMNLELLQAYIGNYSIKELQVPYLTGRFSVIQSQILSKADLFTSGYVALARSVEEPKLLIEQLYPADAEYTDDLRQMLQPGVEIKLERTYDLSAVLHVEKLPDNAWQVTIVPLNYDSYGLGAGREVHLEPPLMPNLTGLLPIIAPHFEDDPSRVVKTARGQSPTPAVEEKDVPVIARSGPTPDQSVVRIARALPVLKTPAAKPTPAAEPTPTPIVLAAIPVATPESTPTPMEISTPRPTPKTIASSAAPTPKSLQSWTTYRPGQMPRGRLLDVPNLDSLAKTGGPKETTYLQGNFVVKATDGNRAVLRTGNRIADSVGLGGAVQGQTRIIVEYPEGQAAPKAGSQVSRDKTRPFQITAVRRDAKGQLNVFVREVTQP